RRGNRHLRLVQQHLDVNSLSGTGVQNRVDDTEAVLGVGIMQVVGGGDVNQHVEAALLLQALEQRMQPIGFDYQAEVVTELRGSKAIGAATLTQLRKDSVMAHAVAPASIGSVRRLNVICTPPLGFRENSGCGSGFCCPGASARRYRW